MIDAECHKPWVNPNWFFAERGKSNDVAMAKFTCFVCPVRLSCNEYSLQTGEKFGIWAGENLQKDE